MRYCQIFYLQHLALHSCPKAAAMLFIPAYCSLSCALQPVPSYLPSAYPLCHTSRHADKRGRSPPLWGGRSPPLWGGRSPPLWGGAKPTSLGGAKPTSLGGEAHLFGGHKQSIRKVIVLCVQENKNRCPASSLAKQRLTCNIPFLQPALSHFPSCRRKQYMNLVQVREECFCILPEMT